MATYYFLALNLLFVKIMNGFEKIKRVGAVRLGPALRGVKPADILLSLIQLLESLTRFLAGLNSNYY